MMQKTIYFVLAMMIATGCYSQCDKKITLSATGVEILNDQDEVKIKDTLRGTTIKFDSNKIEIVSENSVLNGTVDSSYCNWNTPFKEGTTYIKATLEFGNGEQWSAVLTIIGKGGKITLLVDIEHPDANKMRFVLDKFEESQ